jgi:hypothetical protein
VSRRDAGSAIRAGKAAPGAVQIGQILAGTPVPLPTPVPAIGSVQSVLLALDGSGVQLGNNGGTVRLLDDGNVQVDVVTYTGADAATDDRYVRFRR